jgi:acetyl-CoA carboxylase biotin carboxyl carrier protein
MGSIDADVVKHALKVARTHGFAEVELSNGESQFRAYLEPSRKPIPSREATQTMVESDEPEVLTIRSNHVGYYRGENGTLKVGATLTKGDSVASISALGLMHDVESNVAGEVTEVLVSDGDAVQFGQVLAKVKP